MSKPIFYLRLALYSLTLLTVSFIAVLIGVICTLLGQTINTNYYVARTFWYTAGPLMGWKFDVEGEEHLWELKEGAGEGCEGEVGGRGRSGVMVGNHQSFVDILYLGRIFPKEAAIMAKKSIQYLPGLGWFMLMSGTVFINRSNNRSAVASMQTAGEDMKRKKISLWIFPEGTRHLSAENDLLSFKKGAFYLAVQSGAPIIPVVCENYHRMFDGKTRFKSGTLKIRVLPPIPTTGLTTADVPALMERTRDLMIETLKSISSPPTRTSSTERTPKSISDDADAERPLLSDPSTDYATTSTSTSTASDPARSANGTAPSEAEVENQVGEDEFRTRANGTAESILPKNLGLQGGASSTSTSNGSAAKRVGAGKGGLCIA